MNNTNAMMTDRVECFGRQKHKLQSIMQLTIVQSFEFGNLFKVILFLGERNHVRAYGRPITGSRWIVNNYGWPSIENIPIGEGPQPASDFVSESDMSTLDALFRVGRKNRGSLLSDLTSDRAWQAMKVSGVLNYLDFLPEDVDADRRDDFIWLSRYASM
jgi:hypothetical protein